MNISQIRLLIRDRARWLYWNSAAGAVTYSLAYGSATATYTTSLSVGAVLKYKIDDLNLPTNGTIYMAVKAVNATGASSPSNEIVIRDRVVIG